MENKKNEFWWISMKAVVQWTSNKHSYIDIVSLCYSAEELQYVWAEVKLAASSYVWKTDFIMKN